ncbi:(d)CMP kinase [Geothermobacter hydrogeniphilus]|uniref:Cytidylate kinase n=1 Tax=Geothermobacter hydrogeniphilus TaxID=1969733 RepID=A0A2K2HBX8_9BACT|nr:(d)CMP kinase [Geothermobacter hydrogeniphilus]PNU20743.1 (d)CMP kinase [Geothermobacter hydrogeniphilus]
MAESNHRRELIVAIDGPSGVGKSTLSRRLAERLKYLNIDTGAMYRSVALAALRNGIKADDAVGLESLCGTLEIDFRRCEGDLRVFLNGEDVSELIRTPEVSLLTARVAAVAVVRQALVDQQRRLGADGGVVLEGRDIGSVVFPDAEVKIFLQATTEERGRRRYLELRARGHAVDLEQTIREVAERDQADMNRSIAPLVQAEDAVLIDTTGLDVDAVFRRMFDLVMERRRLHGLGALREN